MATRHYEGPKDKRLRAARLLAPPHPESNPSWLATFSRGHQEKHDQPTKAHSMLSRRSLCIWCACSNACIGAVVERDGNVSAQLAYSVQNRAARGIGHGTCDLRDGYPNGHGSLRRPAATATATAMSVHVAARQPLLCGVAAGVQSSLQVRFRPHL
jgi:hypothetical protein